MNIKYLFVVSLTLLLIMPKSTFAQTETIDPDLMSSDDAYASDNTRSIFDDDFGQGNQQFIPPSTRALQNATPSKGLYVDDFLYRWYIQGGVGAQFLMGEDDNKAKFASRLTIAPALTVGYRFSPVFGARLNFTGGSLHGYNDGHAGTYRFWKGKSDAFKNQFAIDNGLTNGINNIDRWDPQWNYKGFVMDKDINYNINPGAEGYHWIAGSEPTVNLYMQHLRYVAANAAASVNLFNLFGGADDSRKFDASIHLGPTFFHVLPHQGVVAYDGFGWNGGIQAQFHASNKIGIFAEFSGMAMPDGFDGQYGGDVFDLIGQAFLGLTYKFATSSIPRQAPKLSVFDDKVGTEIERIRAEVMPEIEQYDDLTPEIDRLRKLLAELRLKETQEIIEPQPESFFLPDPVYFAIGKTDIDAQGWRVIQDVVAYLNEHPNADVIITGYADKDTGTAAINERLSRERSKKVADALVHHNVNPGRVAIDWRGDNIQPFYQNQMNRAVLFYIEFQ